VAQVVALLEQGGFRAERFDWSVNFTGASTVALQLSLEEAYRDFPSRAVPADVHGILMRVASLEDTLAGTILAWSAPARRPSRKLKDLADIARLVEAHPHLWFGLPGELRAQILGADASGGPAA
jgi:hypothetical protein